MKNSREIANRAVAHIKAYPCSTKKEICRRLNITTDQFQAATPYIKTECERVKLGWYATVAKLELE